MEGYKRAVRCEVRRPFPPSATSLTMTPYTKLPILLAAFAAIGLLASEGRADYVLGECCLLRLP